MAKKGFFSWFRKDKSNDEAEQAAKLAEQQAAEAAAETERLAAEKAQAEQAEADRLATEKAQAEQAEAERIAAEKAQAEQAEAERIAAEKAQVEQAEAERIAAEKAQAEQAEAERIAAEKAQAEQAEAERLAAEKAQAEQAEAERIAAEKAQAEQAEAERLAVEIAQAEQAEAERLAAEKAQVEQAEAERLAVEIAQAEQAEAERLAAEKAQAEQAEAERLAAEEAQAEQAAEEAQPEPQAKPAKEGFFARLKRGLMRTSENIGSGFIGLFRGKKIDDDLFEELEEQLLIADVGVETTSRLISSLTDHASRKQLKDAEALYELLQQEMLATLEPVSVPLVPDNAAGPFVILMVGVNGVGKTTTIGKLAKQYQREGKSVMLAAGDTFRAAAVEQLQVWGQRNDIPVIAQHTGADSASVLFDALQAAKARNVDVLIADTAGRLQNKSHLMEELKKVVRVMKKLDPDAPHEVMLTLDASTGQNAISQAQLFQEAVGVTGISISKLDGTAKGGVIFAIADKFGIPIRYIGVGEQIDDLRTFNAKDFIEALFSQEKADN
ncbi:signal recognition particle-docking protein FtsY [Shewanella algae]|uniref:signal recognition particle-docking protein FtsY n=1 Tax=Shewanella algae TaxID=38313 RepID=UPI0016827E03|nr:signal recognition particle-docking protein FtsY [Shewanella algae]MBO2634807.1 signal recognition particle-docking protein FtsY [Shewanella algae]QNV07256.1 signal recognition particle-docking protein FtsY [Shewanella algae]